MLPSFGGLVFEDSRPHQRLEELGTDIALVREFDEAFACFVTGGLDRGLLGGKERRIEPKRAVVLEVLKHPQVRVLAAHIHGEVPLQYLPSLWVDVRTQLPERLEVWTLDIAQLSEEVIDARRVLGIGMGSRYAAMWATAAARRASTGRSVRSAALRTPRTSGNLSTCERSSLSSPMGWAAFWIYWLVAALSMKRSHVPWARELRIGRCSSSL